MPSKPETIYYFFLRVDLAFVPLFKATDKHGTPTSNMEIINIPESMISMPLFSAHISLRTEAITVSIENGISNTKHM